MKTRAVLGLFVFSVIGFGQFVFEDLDYDTFFAQVRACDEGRKLPQPKLRDGLDLTEKEAAALHQTAEDVLVALKQVREDFKGLILEERLIAVESGCLPPPEKQVLRLAEARRYAITRGLQQLNQALGPERFRVLIGHVRLGTLGSYLKVMNTPTQVYYKSMFVP